MRCVVAYKWARDPEDAHVGADGSVDWRNAGPAVGDDDPEAIRIARELAEPGSELLGLTLGDGDASWALARGAERAVVIADAEPGTSSSSTAAILAAAVRRISAVDLVLIGDSAWDRGVPVCLAGQLGWPVLTEVSGARMKGERVRVTRRLGSGRQVVDASLPVVLAVVGRTSEEWPPGMKEILAARRRPLETWALADLGHASEAAVTSVGTRPPDAPPAHLLDGADPADTAARLVAALHSDGVL